MDRFQEMRVFVAVVGAGSFVGALDTLGMSKSAVSRYLGELEARLGVRLLNRTTRRLSLTGEGEVFHARCLDLLKGVEEAEAEITSRSVDVSGGLRINAPVTFGISHLSSVWSEFRALYPQVSLDITLADRVVDLVEEGYDLAIRIARLPNSSLISRKLATTRMVLCASPTYLARAGTPAHPSELAKHAVLAYSYWSGRDEWEFEGPEGRISVKTDPCIRTNNGDTCRVGALRHQGLILQPTFLIGEDLRCGALVEVLPQFRSINLDVHAVYATRKHASPKLRAMIDFLVQWFEQGRWPN